MSDRYSAEIHIGGDIPRVLAKRLYNEIRDSGGGVDWGEDFPQHIKTLDELIRVWADQDAINVFHECARNGQFPDLEVFCERNGIAYDRFSSSYGDYTAESCHYRPGWDDPLTFMRGNDGEIVIGYEPVKIAYEALRRGNFIRALNTLQPHISPEIPKLLPVRIV